MEKVPEWLLFGILIFPIIIILSFLVGLYTKNYLLWLTVPSILFEQMFEKCCYAFSNNQGANIIFAVIVWFLVGAAIGKTAFFSTMSRI